MRLAMIWAMAENRVIGRDGALPWRLPAEMRWFRECTMGKPIIAGRVTFDSFGKPLPNRTNIVISRRSGYEAPGAVVTDSLESAVERAREQCATDGVDEAVVVGGTQIYQAALPLAERFYMTVVHAHIEGDTFFPAFDQDQCTVVTEQRVEADERNAVAFTKYVLDRKV